MPANTKTSAPIARQQIREAVAYLKKSRAIDHWRSGLEREDATELLAAALRLEADDELDLDAVIPAASQKSFWRMIERRYTGEPVALIRGYIDFYGLRLRVKQGVFIPRGTSETLADAAIASLRGKRKGIAVEVACGAGPVALAIADQMPRAEVWGLDISPAAIQLSRANARAHGITNAHFRVSDLLSELPASLRGKVSVITIHPPYVKRNEVRTLPKEIRAFEPRQTLTDESPDGLGLVRRLAEEGREFLNRGGKLLVEMAPYMVPSTRAALHKYHYKTFVASEPGDITRVVVAEPS